MNRKISKMKKTEENEGKGFEVQRIKVKRQTILMVN